MKLRRKKKKMTLWLKPETYEWLKKNIPNRSNFIEQLIDATKEKMNINYIVISRVGAEEERKTVKFYDAPLAKLFQWAHCFVHRKISSGAWI